MKISGYSQNYINQNYAKSTVNERTVDQGDVEKENRKSSESDNISLSQTTLDRQSIDKNMDNAQPDREGHVQALKAQVEAGQYNVHADKVAEKMVGFYMDDLA